MLVEVARTLYLLRHAKSSWANPALPDHERPLAPRGRRACSLIAAHLRREQIVPDLVLCSSSARTRETLRRVATGFERPSEAVIEARLYGVAAAGLLARLHEVPGNVASLMLIGHNPALQELALELAASGTRREAVMHKFPTAALATLAFTASWAELAPGIAEVTAFVTPRALEHAHG
jgi:phosphohistidine phosphatase